MWGEWRCAYDAWLLQMEEHCIGYATEEREYRYNNPSPKFKDFLIHLSQGLTQGREQDPEAA